MDVSTWIGVTREDGESVGYLERVTPDYDTVQPRTVLGHPAGEPCDYLAGEELLCERGISELMQYWKLREAPAALAGELSILEVSPHGIVVADALLTKALIPGEKATVGWPDLEGYLVPAPR